MQRQSDIKTCPPCTTMLWETLYKVLLNLAAIQARAYNGQKQQKLASLGVFGEITGEDNATKLKPIVCKCLRAYLLTCLSQ